MKRQPGQPADALKFKKGLILFIVTALISVGSGLFLLRYLEGRPLQDRLNQIFENQKDYQVGFSDVEVRFRRGWLPAVAVTVGSMVVRQSDCSGRRILAENLFFNLDIFKILRSEFSPRSLFVGDVLVTWPKGCKSISDLPTTGPALPLDPSSEIPKVNPVQSEVPEILSQKARILFEEFVALQEKILIPKFKIKRFQFLWSEKGVHRIQLKGGVQAQWDGQALSINLYPKQLWFKEKKLQLKKGVVSFLLSSQKLDLTFDTFVREGKVSLAASLENNIEYSSKVSLSLKKIPISVLTNLFIDKISLQYLWANCHFKVTGNLDHLQEEIFSLQDCQLTGPYGEAEVVSSAFSFEAIQLLAVNFKNFQLDKVIRDRGQFYLSGIFSSFGMASGELLIDQKKRWNIKGAVQDSILVFSRNNFREVQTLKKLPFEIHGDEESIKASIADVEIADGEFEGALGLSVSEDKSTGEGFIKLKKLALNPKVTQLMLAADQAQFGVNARFKIRDYKFLGWTGDLSVPFIRGEHFEFQDGKISIEKGEGVTTRFKVVALKGRIPKSSLLGTAVEPTLLNSNWPEDQRAVEEFSVNIEFLGEKQWRWSRGYGRFANQWQVSSEGVSTSTDGLRGWLQWDIPSQQILRWEGEGSLAQMRWSPQKPWMKSWLKLNPDFRSKNPNIIENNKIEVSPKGETSQTFPPSSRPASSLRKVSRLPFSQ